MFGIKGRDTFNKPFSDRAKIARILKEKWVKYFPYFVGFLILAAMTFAMYTWYVHVHTKELTQSERDAYINEKKQEVIFRQKKFDQIKDGIIARQEKFGAESINKNDIFYHVKVEEEENENTTE